MDKRTTGIIVTVVAVLLCGCPGLAGLCFGAVMVLAGVVPGAEIDIFGSQDQQAALTTGIVSLCASLLLIVIPVVLGYVFLRNKPEDNFDEAIPPAI